MITQGDSERSLMIRIMRALTRITIGGFTSFFLRIKWLFFQGSRNTFSDYSVHLLVVKNPSYSYVAQVCIESFLHFHPNAKVVVHGDQRTEKSLRKALRIVMVKRDLEIIIDQDSSLTWQEQKVNLILQLSGTDDIFIDADLKWNGSMPNKKGICFFVEEFVFADNPLYQEVLPQIKLTGQLENSMKNTSFFSWGGEKFTPSKKDQILEFISGFEKQVALLDLSETKKQEVSRIVEQLGLSIMFDRKECVFLKESDAQFDGSFVESSYFGATGTKFGKFGITSRRF